MNMNQLNSFAIKRFYTNIYESIQIQDLILSALLNYLKDFQKNENENIDIKTPYHIMMFLSNLSLLLHIKLVQEWLVAGG